MTTGLGAARPGNTPLSEYSYSYSGKGKRVLETDAGQSTVHHYDGQGRPIAETDAQQAVPAAHPGRWGLPRWN